MVDVLQWFNYTTFDNIGDFLWSSSFGCLEEVPYHPWIQVTAQFETALIAGASTFYYPLDQAFMMVTPASALADLMQIWKTTECKIAHCLESGSEWQDMVSYIAQPLEHSRHMLDSREEM